MAEDKEEDEAKISPDVSLTLIKVKITRVNLYVIRYIILCL